MFCKKDVLTSFAKFTGKHLFQSLFFMKKRLWHRCFTVNFAKFLRTPFLIEHLWWLLLMITSKKTEFTTSVCHLGNFQNQEYQFTNPKFRTRLVDKREGGMQMGKRYAFHQNAKDLIVRSCLFPVQSSTFKSNYHIFDNERASFVCQSYSYES